MSQYHVIYRRGALDKAHTEYLDCWCLPYGMVDGDGDLLIKHFPLDIRPKMMVRAG